MAKETEKWIEEATKANMAFQISCADALERQGSAFLNLLLAGAGGALAYTVSLVEKGAQPWQYWGMGAASIWLFTLSALVLLRVLWARELYGPGNDPRNLAAAYRLPLYKAQRYELENRQFCIDENRKRTASVSRWLNATRLLASLTPLVFSAVASVAYIRL